MNLVQRYSLNYFFLYFALNKNFTLKVEMREVSFIYCYFNIELPFRGRVWVDCGLSELLMLDEA